MKLTALLAGAIAAFALAVQAESPEPKKDGKDDFHELLERAQKAKAEGRYEEARELAEQLRQKRGIDKTDRKPDGERPERMARVKEEIEELHRAGKHEEAEQLKRKYQGEFMAKHRPDGKGPAPEDERLGHLQEAIKHLRAAQINEPADQLERMAEHLREELQARKRAEGEEFRKKHPEGGKHGPEAGQLREVRERLDQMNRKIEELNAKLQKLQAPPEVPKP